MNRIVANLKMDCCTDAVLVYSDRTTYRNLEQVKLYDKIEDACLENNNFNWYSVTTILGLNDAVNRPKGIVCHHCPNGKCVLSLIIDKSENTRFCVGNKIEII